MPYGFVYMTVNLINGMKYIGKKNYDQGGRWRKYLGSGIALQCAVRKYGKDKFIRIMLDEANSVEELNRMERDWIDMFEACTNREFYNIAAGGDGGYVIAGYSPEERDKIEKERIANVKMANTGRYKECAAKLTVSQVKEIISMLLNADYMSDIARRYGVAAETIRDIANHKTWKFLTDGIEFPDISRHKKVAGEKAICQYTYNWDYIATYKSARDAEKHTGVGFRLISQVCNGEKPSAHGFRFAFAQEKMKDAENAA